MEKNVFLFLSHLVEQIGKRQRLRDLYKGAKHEFNSDVHYIITKVTHRRGYDEMWGKEMEYVNVYLCFENINLHRKSGLDLEAAMHVFQYHYECLALDYFQSHDIYMVGFVHRKGNRDKILYPSPQSLCGDAWLNHHYTDGVLTYSS